MEETAAELALAQAHPAWMVERWASFYGLEAARAICRHGQSQPALTVRLASPAVEAELHAAGIVLEAGELLTAARTVVSGDVTATAAFHEGRVRLQDEGSQLVAELAGCEILDQKREKNPRLLAPLPAAKTLILAERNPQARIVACESSAPRLEQLRKRLAGSRRPRRMPPGRRNRAYEKNPPSTLCWPTCHAAAPARWAAIRRFATACARKTSPRQAERQRAILNAALRAVRPGGRVVYSTCSLEPEENEQVVAAVLAATPNARPISLESRIEALLSEGILTPSGAERLHALPHARRRASPAPRRVPHRWLFHRS